MMGGRDDDILIFDNNPCLPIVPTNRTRTVRFPR